MASARKDFEEFIRWVHLPANQITPDVRRLSNLVLNNFDRVLASSRQHSQRSILLASLARQHLAQTSDTQPEIAPLAADAAWPWARLRQFTVGPFRGFRTPEPFDLQKRIVLFYGPNGSGKSSLCEALEYALLGSVDEAEAKRIAAEVYLSNIHERRFAPPILKATDHRGREIDVTANSDAYRFCFIEKNRIDSFSRIAARPTGQRAELIATLFGMEKFNEFVGHFNDSMDGQLILSGAKQLLLSTKRIALAQDNELIGNEAISLRGLDTEEHALAITYSEEMTYIELKELLGSVENPGYLQQLNELLNFVPPQVLGATQQRLQELYTEADTCHSRLQQITEALGARANQVSFKDLYTAVLALQPTEGEHCPACNTPLEGLNHVLNNPYEKATAGLEELAELAAIQQNQIAAIEELATVSRNLNSALATILQFIIANDEQETSIGRYLASLPQVLTGRWWATILEDHAVQNGLPTLEDILETAQRIELQDNASRTALATRQENILERDKLLRYQLLIQQQDRKREQLLESLATARDRIATFEIANANLIAEATQERLDIERDAPIKAAYDNFHSLLRRYRNQLPGTLIAGLNERAMNLYNEFNRNDLDADKLAALHLPLTGEQKIELSFRGNPQARVDALKILSEGHVRCLGLAILLAKSLSLDSPLIVFDDAINAIDHDHRRGIREAIFESDNFANTQIIVTCHSHEFIKDIQQCLTVPNRNDSKVYLFRNHNGDYHPRVNGNIPSRNYVEMARADREQLNDRGALDASRKAIEMLTEKIWRWLGSYEHGIISLKIAGPTAEPNLRNLCEALRSKLATTQAFAHANKPLIIAAFDRILGIPEQNFVWEYLNKGTHEEADRDDFDGNEVESVVVTLEALDALDLRPGR